MRRRALITGITGMVGSHLAEYLLSHTDWDIHGMIRWRSPLDNLGSIVERINDGDRVFLHYGDLRDQISLGRVIDAVAPNYVFHLAAQSFPKTSFDAPIDTLDTNVQGTLRLMEALRDIGTEPFIHICSSSEVYGRVIREALPIGETCEFHPSSPYAISKAGADLVARFYAEAYEMRVLTTRMFTHTGPRRGDVFAESSFAKQIAMIEAEMMEPVVKVGNLNSLRTYSDVRDAVRAYHMLLTVHPIPGEVYNIGGEHVCKVGDMLNTLLSMSERRDIKVVEDPNRMRPLDADLQVPDTSKFRNHTGWKPEIPFDQTMKDLLDYWRERVAARRVVIQR